MKNLMPEVAKLLGVEIGEEFKVNFNDITYCGAKEARARITKNDFQLLHQISCQWVDFNGLMLRLIKGEFEIIKLPWKPKNSEEYWIVEEDMIFLKMWESDMSDFMYLKCGNCFRTKEEAEANADRIRKEIMGGRADEWQ